MASPTVGRGILEGMLRPTAFCTFRIREKASVFLTELHPAEDGDARAALLARIRKRDFDASHHCSAWREQGGAWGADDDGEPGGTAGAPMLKVLEGEGLVDVLVVCTRWFGGTKLGTGGLVRAYTEAVQGAVAAAREEGLLETVKLWRAGTIHVPADQAHLPFAILGAWPGAEVLGQTFDGTGATVAFRVPQGQEAAVAHAWRERSRGGHVLWDAFADPSRPFADHP